MTGACGEDEFASSKSAAGMSSAAMSALAMSGLVSLMVVGTGHRGWRGEGDNEQQGEGLMRKAV